jgi:branched-chain amino acid aminotransferase
MKENFSMTIEIIKTSRYKKKPQDWGNIEFGKTFTDHMLVMRFDENQGGWGPAEIRPYGPLNLEPAACCLHYGQEIFEGLKCYKSSTGDLQLFRPRDNFKRMNKSAERMSMPTLDVEYVLESLIELIRLDQDWVPRKEFGTLYIRPTMIASEPLLGVHAAKEYLFFIILSPVGNYFKNGFHPLHILVEDKYVRACNGGVGDAKTAGNYASSLKASESAKKQGYAEVLWLDAFEHKNIAEVGAMNIAFVINDEIITSPLDGTILPGITRDSVIQISKEKGYQVIERPISINEIISGIQSKILKEAFGMGTAAIIAPIGAITYKNQKYEINKFNIGNVTQNLYKYLTEIQFGEICDTFGWISQI